MLSQLLAAFALAAYLAAVVPRVTDGRRLASDDELATERFKVSSSD